MPPPPAASGPRGRTPTPRLYSTTLAIGDTCSHVDRGGTAMRHTLSILVLVGVCSAVGAQERPPFHLGLEPEWFDGVKGSFAYWTGTAKPSGTWGIAGPGISAEW